MKYIKLDLENYTKEIVREIAREILAGKVVVLPTDTVYGLHALATSQKAIDKVWKIKKRKLEDQKHLLLLVKSFCMVRRYCYLTKKQYNYLKENWQKKRALTVILKGRDDITLSQKRLSKNYTTIQLNSCIDARRIVSTDNGIAVRLPQNNFLIDLIKEVGEPLVSTSLNVTGQKEIDDIKNLEKYFKIIKPDVVVDAGILPRQKPSRLIDIRDMEGVKVYRK